MTALRCPACRLQQTLAAPRCARCGAPLEGSAPVAPEVGSPRPAASIPDDRTVLRDALLAPPQPGSFLPTSATSRPPSGQPSFWQRLWRRLVGQPERP
ncbi:hypothetical protein [Micropruina sp.]|uniref:hypothetical protein n=1 Tax=Micropruina sp. TaxID=2737536 RepID=UPI0039E54BB9